MSTSPAERPTSHHSNRQEAKSPHGISLESKIDQHLETIEAATQKYSGSLREDRLRTDENFSAAKLHSVFRVERRGDTLIVTPRGDTIGFGHMEYQTELNRVLGILENPEISNLLVDLGFANYFGSQMIGAINSMIVKVRNAGGASGVCDVSDDMLEGLSVMNLHDFWTIYATRNDAIRLLVTEPVSSQARRQWKWIAISMVVILSSVGIGHFNFDIFGLDDTNVRFYRTIEKVFEHYRELKEKDTNRNEWKIFSANAKEELQPILRELQKRKHVGDSPKMYLLIALREGLMPIVYNPNYEHSHYETIYRTWMAKAREKIATEDVVLE